MGGNNAAVLMEVLKGGKTMSCNVDWCEIEIGPKVCPKCGREPVTKVNTLTAWLKCPVCGRCAIGSNKREAVKNWNKQEMK